ncbi:MAG: transglycosylase domain-containing protein [Terrisporobacter sp.]|uniref:transglycosylase domain-containing protein n=1 Tax=Terrisporobacter sp. TaxID=1965305 RepID=UPI002FCAE16C
MGRDDRDDKNKIKRRKVSSSDKKNTPQASSSSNNARSSAKKKKTSSKSNGRFKGAKTVGVVFLAVLVVGVAVASGIVFASLRNTEPVTKALLEKKTYQTTELYYADGQLLSKAETSDKKDPVSDLSEIDKDVQNALVATEDERFYEHNGVDLRGLARSVVKTLTGTKQGGSTIPMQVSKMLITSQEQSITRKIKDIYYAYEMSKTVSKEDILLAYLNNFYAGRGLYGVKAAAQGYFSKDISKNDTENDLTPGEAALLIGSTNNPAIYSPYTTDKLNGAESKENLENKLLFYVNTQDDTLDEPTDVEMQMIDKLSSWGLIPDADTYKQLKNKTMVVRKAVPNEKAKNKQKIILGKMLKLNYITQAQYDEEVAKPIEIKLSRSKTNIVSSVEDYVYSEVIDSLMEQGYTKEEANNMYYNGGLRIYTTIDSGMQDNLEEQYDNDNNFPVTSARGEDGIIQPQSAMVILDHKTSQIKSLIGGRHVKGKRTLNRATTPKQPGSTIKPLSVYAPAIDTLEYTQSTAYSDARGGYKFKDNQKWNPKTTTPARDTWSLRKALAMSSNTIAVKTAESLGDSYSEATDVMIDYLKNFGISTLLDSKTKEVRTTDRQFSSLVLGGMSHGISPLEMAAAYATLANGGQYIEPTVFTTITTYDGQLLVKSNPEENRVVSEDVAYVLTDMLQAVVTEGTGKSASLGDMPVAGKTGTTNDGLDVWFAGYTPYYVGVTYIGDDAGRTDAQGNKISRQSVPGTSSTAAGLWSKVMGPIHENLMKDAKFSKPAGVYFTKINPVDGGTSSYGVSAAFVEGTYPSRATSQPSPVQKPTVEEEEEENPSTNDTGDGGNPPEEDGDQGGETPPEKPTPTPPSGGDNNTNTPEPPVDNTQGGNSQNNE